MFIKLLETYFLVLICLGVWYMSLSSSNAELSDKELKEKYPFQTWIISVGILCPLPILVVFILYLIWS